MWQLFHPSSFHVVQPLLQPVYYDLVNGFSLPILLGVGQCGVSIRNSQLTVVLFESLTIELKTIVQD